MTQFIETLLYLIKMHISIEDNEARSDRALSSLLTLPRLAQNKAQTSSPKGGREGKILQESYTER